MWQPFKVVLLILTPTLSGIIFVVVIKGLVIPALSYEHVEFHKRCKVSVSTDRFQKD